MPPKSTVRARTWGTRFDPLPSSPPPSPPREVSLASDAQKSTTHLGPQSKRKDERLPHDASLFVGSLPPQIDQQELTRMLYDHLSGHTEVKNIKVVRDSKGGVCAFVQCEDSTTAGRLIQTLQSAPPRPFAGRFLRYERARAFRSLLVSYRTPTKFIPASAVPESEQTSLDMEYGGRTVEIELATAIKLIRPAGSRYTSILYNAEARDSENQEESGMRGDSDGYSYQGSVLYLSPLIYDAETIRKMALLFGPIECFRHYKDKETSNSERADSDVSTASYPSPHDSPRSPGMDAGCWEIKWEHRDDCINALMTLRRVPHLAVTWAHQPGAHNLEQQPTMLNQSPNTAPYPFHVRARTTSNTSAHTSLGDFQTAFEPRFHRPDYIRPRALSSSSPGETAPAFLPSAVLSRDGKSLTIRTTGLSHGGFQTNVASSTTYTQEPMTPRIGSDDERRRSTHPSSPDNDKKSFALSEMSNDASNVAWTEHDFPPLGNQTGKMTTPTGLWAERMNTQIHSEETERAIALRSPSVISTATDTPVIQNTPRSSFSHPENFTEATDNQQGAQEIDIPPTPELGLSPFTPKTAGSAVPHTPGSFVGEPQHNSSFKNNFLKAHHNLDEPDGEREVDPTSIFVGGLDMLGPYAWDEERLKSYFGKYGTIQDIKVVRPMNNKSAFAFVKFDDTEAPARAVSEERERSHDGRQMRVQLRDCNPPRRMVWRYGRGRGRFGQYGTHVPESDSEKPAGRDNEEDHHAESYKVSESSSFNDFSVNAVKGGVLPSHVPEPAVTRIQTEKQDGSQVSTTGSRRTSLASYQEFPPRGQQAYEFQESQTTASLTPPSSSFGSSASVTAPVVPYPVSYFPPPWMQHYPQQYSYPVPFVTAYQGYGVPAQQPHQSLVSPASDPSGHAVTVPQQWSGVYTPFVPYTTYPARPANMDQLQTLNQPQPDDTRAPLAPTGFIQSEQGTLIPVYQPEALNQYMSGSQQSNAPTAQTQPPYQSQAHSALAWHHYTLPSFYPHVPAAPAINIASRDNHLGPSLPSSGSVSWASCPSSMAPPTNTYQPNHFQNVPYANFGNRATAGQSACGGYFGTGHGQQHGASNEPPLRRLQRRGQSNGSHINIQSGGRQFGNRLNRGGAPAMHVQQRTAVGRTEAHQGFQSSVSRTGDLNNWTPSST